MAENYSSKGGTDLAWTGLLVFLVVLLGSWLIWEEVHTDLVYWSMWLNWHVLSAIAWIWSPGWLSEMRGITARAALNAARIQPMQLWSILNHDGLVMVPVLLLVLAGLLRKMQKHPSNGIRRAIDPERLRWIMARHAPAIIPTLYYPNLLENDPPEFRSFESPEEWALRHRLVVNHRLDRTRTEKLLVETLGTRLTSLNDLNAHERAMFAVFGARLLSDGADIGVAQELLDELNFSCHKGTYQGRRGYPDLSIAQVYFEKYAAHPLAAEWLATHGYSRTLLHAMHQEAINKGKVPSSHFIWLFTMDRGLYAALNTTGRKVPYVESLGVFTQARWESFAQNMSLRLTVPHLDDAVDALSSYLEKVGLVTSPPKGKD